MAKPNLLVNLPPGFFKVPYLKPLLARLAARANVRKRSYNTPEEIIKDLRWADAVIMWSWPKFDDAMLDQCPNLKFCGHLDISQSGGEVALRRGLAVSQGRRAFSPAVSEMALGLILSGLRHISTFHEQMRAGKEPWVGAFPDDIDPTERQLTGRNVGIVGFGQVGQRLGELLAPFRPTLRIYDPFLPAEVAKKHNAEPVTLEALCRQSEVLVICAASNAGTKHLVSAKLIKSMPKNALLVNVARAALVDTDALVARLQKGDLFAAIDVFDKEPADKKHPLRKLPNALLTPHRAGGIVESVVRIVGIMVEDFENHLDGKPLANPLTKGMIPALDA